MACRSPRRSPRSGPRRGERALAAEAALGRERAHRRCPGATSRASAAPAPLRRADRAAHSAPETWREPTPRARLAPMRRARARALPRRCALRALPPMRLVRATGAGALCTRGLGGAPRSLLAPPPLCNPVAIRDDSLGPPRPGVKRRRHEGGGQHDLALAPIADAPTQIRAGAQARGRDRQPDRLRPRRTPPPPTEHSAAWRTFNAWRPCRCVLRLSPRGP